MARKSKRTPTVPAIGPMTDEIVTKVSGSSDKFKKAIEEIIIELGTGKFNVETLLSNLEDKARLLGANTLNALNKADFEELILEVKKNVRKLVSVSRERK